MDLTDEQRRGLVRAAAEFPIIAALAVLIVVILRAFVVQPFYIPSPSMVPQLKVNDKILVSRISYRLHPIHRGDLVVFDAPPGVLGEASSHHKGPIAWVTERLGLTPRNDVLVKRVIGLPGDTVQVEDGHIYINGHLLIEPYLPAGLTSPTPQFGPNAPFKVPPGELYVLGDNRNDSEDSHVFGAIRRSSVIGRAVVRVWPLDKIAFL
jgi:signal peptidase I